MYYRNIGPQICSLTQFSDGIRSRKILPFFFRPKTFPVTATCHYLTCPVFSLKLFMVNEDYKALSK